HFLEHKLFEEETGSAFDRFAEWGASANAFTSYAQTSYLFSTIDHWGESLAHLIGFVSHPYLTAENVEKEKGIIEQELRMYEDHPYHRLYSNLLRNLYHENPVRLDIGGTVESIYKITVAELLTCYHTFYQPPNMALAVVGDVDSEETLRIIADNFPGQSQNSTFAIERFYPKEPQEVVDSWSEEELSVSRPHYLLGFKHEPRWEGAALLKQQIIMSLIWGMLVGRSSQVYADLYGADLVDDSLGAAFNSGPCFAYSVIGSETDAPEKLHEELKKIIERLQKTEVSPTDLERLKRQLYGKHLASYDSFEYAANRFISHHFSGTPFYDFIPLLQSVTVSDIGEALNELLDYDNSTVAILRPVTGNG
ncbi:MAG TPA: insulinase family protein, partial [Firmicutes bacterium]|nr:insulinase family protein [Bacillota bacterium]